MKSVILILSFLIVRFSFAQFIKFQTPNNWQLYDIHKSGSLRYSVDTLKTFNHIDLPGDSMLYFLKNIKAWPKDQSAAWMGTFIASCEINKELRKIDISVYGGFFYDEHDKQYYEIPKAIRNDWMDYLNRAFDKMLSK